MKYEIKTSFLEEFAEVKGGKRLPKGVNLQTIPNSHPYIRIRDLGSSKILDLNASYEYVDDETQKTIARYIVNEGDILISIVGTIGLIGIVGKTLEKANLTENCVKLVNISGIDREYLYYFLTSKLGQDEIAKGTVGAVQPKLPIKSIQKIAIRYPSEISIQKRITSILRCIDEKIELNNKINNNLQQQAVALFRSWFVDFAPFGGTMPIGWNTDSLGEVTEMGAGGDKPKITSPTKTEECPYPIFSNGLNDYGLYGYTNEAKIHAESVTVSARGTIGFVCLRHVPYVPIVRLVTLIPKREFMSAKYLYLYLRQLNISGTGTTQQQLTVPDFRKTEILIPDRETMTSFTELIAPMFEKMWANEEENASLTKIRDALLPKLMSSEIDVSGIDI